MNEETKQGYIERCVLLVGRGCWLAGPTARIEMRNEMAEKHG